MFIYDANGFLINLNFIKQINIVQSESNEKIFLVRAYKDDGFYILLRGNCEDCQKYMSDLAKKIQAIKMI